MMLIILCLLLFCNSCTAEEEDLLVLIRSERDFLLASLNTFESDIPKPFRDRVPPNWEEDTVTSPPILKTRPKPSNSHCKSLPFLGSLKKYSLGSDLPVTHTKLWTQAFSTLEWEVDVEHPSIHIGPSPSSSTLGCEVKVDLHPEKPIARHRLLEEISQTCRTSLVYMLTEESQCQAFFASPTHNNKVWVEKTDTRGVVAVLKGVAALKEQFGGCKVTSPSVLVQQAFVDPFLIHLRRVKVHLLLLVVSPSVAFYYPGFVALSSKESRVESSTFAGNSVASKEQLKKQTTNSCMCFYLLLYPQHLPFLTNLH